MQAKVQDVQALAQALPFSPGAESQAQPQEQLQVPLYDPARQIVDVQHIGPSRAVNSVLFYSTFSIQVLKNDTLNLARFLKWMTDHDEAVNVPFISNLCDLLTAPNSALSGEQWASLYYLGCAREMPPNTRYSGPPPVQPFANGRSDFYAALYAKYVLQDLQSRSANK